MARRDDRFAPERRARRTHSRNPTHKAWLWKMRYVWMCVCVEIIYWRKRGNKLIFPHTAEGWSDALSVGFGFHSREYLVRCGFDRINFIISKVQSTGNVGSSRKAEPEMINTHRQKQKAATEETRHDSWKTATSNRLRLTERLHENTRLLSRSLSRGLKLDVRRETHNNPLLQYRHSGLWDSMKHTIYIPDETSHTASRTSSNDNSANWNAQITIQRSHSSTHTHIRW